MTATTQGPTTHNAPRRDASEGFGQRLRAARIAAGLSQAELARRIPCDHSYVSRWESGARRPSPDALRAIATVLHLDPNRLIIESFCDAPFARRVVREMWGD